ncbi:MAG: stage IV sporulation protein A [Ruminococcaceae bacterium]|nr:stage IV sporulation protein A [Oscillospiraceae bacterium]
MTGTSIYSDIAARTGGDIYIGVVGPVRTGKSTFIKKFMDTLVIPNIVSEYQRDRATDELPQSAGGRTIMTTEPKFVPEKGVEIKIDNNIGMNVRLIDCVGYIVPSSLGYIEDDNPRMVMTPWFENPVPFNMAAEYGTKRVITEHSTVGLVITTDGSISDIPREEYEEAEERVITELKAINKPFVILLNSMYPESERALTIAKEISEKYGVGVKTVNCLELDENQITDIISGMLYEFPLKEIKLKLPMWITALDSDHWLQNKIYKNILNSADGMHKVADAEGFATRLAECENMTYCGVGNVDLGHGCACVNADIDRKLFYDILKESTGVEINNEQQLMKEIVEFSSIKKEYYRFKNALDEVEATGYGIVMPQIDELSLEEPEIVKQGGRYGVRLRASAPSIHMMKANITTEVSPIVGSEKQSEDLVMYLLNEFEEEPTKIWDSNIFGKSLHELVNEGLHTKLARMPVDARMRLQETLERVINEGCSGLICIIL